MDGQNGVLFLNGFGILPIATSTLEQLARQCDCGPHDVPSPGIACEIRLSGDAKAQNSVLEGSRFDVVTRLGRWLADPQRPWTLH